MDKYKIGERVIYYGKEIEIIGKRNVLIPTSSYTNYFLAGEHTNFWVAEEDLKPIKDKIEKIDMKNYENIAVSTVLTKLNEIIDYINKKENVK